MRSWVLFQLFSMLKEIKDRLFPRGKHKHNRAKHADEHGKQKEHSNHSQWRKAHGLCLFDLYKVRSSTSRTLSVEFYTTYKTLFVKLLFATLRHVPEFFVKAFEANWTLVHLDSTERALFMW